MFNILIEFSLSKFPVHSSAMIIDGLFTIARAIATLCNSPPDNSSGYLLYLSAILTLDNTSITRGFISFFLAPTALIAISTFSYTVFSLKILKS